MEQVSESVAHCAIRKDSTFYKDYVCGEVTASKYKFNAGPFKTAIESPWLAHMSMAAASDDRAKAKDKQESKASTSRRSKGSDAGSAATGSENVAANPTEELQQALKFPCFPYIVYPGPMGPMMQPGFSSMMPPAFSPMMAPGFTPMMAPGFSSMMPPGMMTPQYGHMTPQHTCHQSHHLQADANVPPHLRLTAAKIPLEPDLYATPVDPREERARDGVYGAALDQPARPFELRPTSETVRFIEKYKRTMNDFSFHESEDSIGRHRSTSGNSSDSEISPPFEPLDNPSSPHVLVSSRTSKAADAHSASSSGNESDASTSGAYLPIKSETVLGPIVHGKRKRRESSRLRERNESHTKRKKVAPIVINLNGMKAKKSKSKPDGDDDGKSECGLLLSPLATVTNR